MRFIAHQGTQRPDVLRAFLGGHPSASGVEVGSTVFLPRYSPATADRMLRELDVHGDFAFADVESHRLHYAYDQRGRARDDYPYLQESDPVLNSARFVQGVVRAQQASDRPEVMSPWLLHGTAPNMDFLTASLQFAATARGLLSAHERLLVGLAVAEGVIRSDEAADDFLDEVTELHDETLYLRISTMATESFTQYRDEEILAGAGRVIEALAENGLEVLLPQTGLFGWLMLAFGAEGFGTGINNSLQAFVPPAPGFGQPLEWYFYRPLLTFVLRPEAPEIDAALGIDGCDCPYCERLNLRGGGPWDKDAAGLHYLTMMARLTESVAAATTPRDGVQSEVGSAMQNLQAVERAGVVLDQRSVPRHLEVWSRVVA